MAFLLTLALTRSSLASAAVRTFTSASVSLRARACCADWNWITCSAVILDSDGDGGLSALNRRQASHSLGMSGQLELQDSIVVDLDGGGAVHWVPAQLESAAVAFHNAGIDLASAINASRAAVGNMRLTSASAHGSHGNANSLLADVGDANGVVSTGDLHDAIVVLGSALARWAARRR